MNWLIHLNSFGLILDIIGVLMMFVYGLKVDDLTTASFKIPMKGPMELSREGKRRYRISKIGLVILIIGFVCQLVGNYF